MPAGKRRVVKKTSAKKSATKKTTKKPFYSPTFIPKRNFIRKFKVILIVGPKLNAQLKAIFRSDKPPSKTQVENVNIALKRFNSLCNDAHDTLVASKGVLGETETLLRHNVHSQIVYATEYYGYATREYPDCGIMSLSELESTHDRVRKGDK